MAVVARRRRRQNGRSLLRPHSRLDRLADTLKLNKDQKKDIKATMDDAQKEATPLHEQMNKSRLAIAEAVAAGKPKEEIEKAVMGEAELETQMTALELHAFAKALKFPRRRPEEGGRHHDALHHGPRRLPGQELERRPIEFSLQ